MMSSKLGGLYPGYLSTAPATLLHAIMRWCSLHPVVVLLERLAIRPALCVDLSSRRRDVSLPLQNLAPCCCCIAAGIIVVLLLLS
jgi:hypothetical protein